MPKGLQAHPAERIDLDDFNRGVRTFTQDSIAQVVSTALLDNQGRYLRGFRVEIPNQTNYPGRIVVHGGDAYDPSGIKLLNEDQVKVSRTITLEGVSTDFYVEIEFIEGDSDVDARAFWDPTVDQGADVSGDSLPDGQEFSDIIATRKSPDWKIVTPVTVNPLVGFARSTDPSSTKVPLVLLGTDGANHINATGNTQFSTSPLEKFATTLLEIVTLSLIRVQDAQLFLVGNDIIVGQGAASTETRTINNVDPINNLITLSSGLTGGTHTPGEICRAVTAATSALDLIPESSIGRYRRDRVGAVSPNHEIDVKDKLFQGDEVHGDILLRGHSSPIDRSDVSLQALKDHVDLLSAKLQEMQWGHPDPYESKESTNRIPPGLGGNLLTTPRYFDKPEGSLAGARIAAITIGDGINSWGDLNGTTDSVFTAAHAALPSIGGMIFVKNGTYIFGADVTLGSKNVIIAGQGPSTNIRTTTTQRFVLTGASTERVSFRDIKFRGTAVNAIGIRITGGSPDISVENCTFEDAIVSVGSAMPNTAVFRGCIFKSNTYTMTQSFFYSSAGAGTVSGTIDTCDFLHPNAAASSALVDTDTNTSGFVECNFINCRFDSSGAGLATFLVGANTDGLYIDKCSFTSNGSAATHFIYMLNGGRRVTVSNSISYDTGAGLIKSDVFAREISIHNFRTSVVVADQSVLSFNNSNNVKVSNCRILVSSTNAIMADGCIKITNTDGTGSGSSDYLIEGNELFEFGTNVVAGVSIIGSAGIPIFDGIMIVNNKLNGCTVGVYIFGSLPTTVEDLKITGNSFSSVKKNGVLIGDSSLNTSVKLVNICDNSFDGITDGTAVEVSPGFGRSAIRLDSDVTNFTIDGNSIRNVGDSGISAFGIFLTRCNSGVISNNTIEDVAAPDVAGIYLGDNVRTVTVSGNSFNVIQGTTAATNTAFGIELADTVLNCVISNNVGERMNQALFAANICAFIGCSTAGSVLSQIVLEGNSYRIPSGANRQRMFHFDVTSISNIIIKNNDCYGDNSLLVGALFMAASTSLKHITVSGNAFRNIKETILDISGPATSNEQIHIVNNTLEMVGIGAVAHAVRLIQVDMVMLNSNTVKTTNITATAMYLLSVPQFSVTDNIVRQTDLGTGDGVLVAACTNYIISNNIFDGTKGGGNFSIDTSGSGGGGIVVENMLNGGSSLVGGDDVSGTGNTAF